MKCDFSEKAYETFVNHELLTNGYHLYIPSSKQEKILGFDSLVSNSIFQVCCLQYKVPKKVKSRRNIWHGQFIFKFNPHKDKNTNQYSQHNLLVNFNKQGIPALYCAPLFIDIKNLYQFLGNNTLLANSALLKPIHSLNVPPNNHSIEFTFTQAYQFCENGEALQKLNSKEIFETSKWFQKDEFLNRLREICSLEQAEKQSISSILAKNKIALLFNIKNSHIL